MRSAQSGKEEDQVRHEYSACFHEPVPETDKQRQYKVLTPERNAVRRPTLPDAGARRNSLPDAGAPPAYNAVVFERTCPFVQSFGRVSHRRSERYLDMGLIHQRKW